VTPKDFATGKSLRKYEQSTCHKEAIEVMVTLPPAVRDIGELSSQCIIKAKVSTDVSSNLIKPAHQGSRDKDEKDGNFMQVLLKTSLSNTSKARKSPDLR